MNSQHYPSLELCKKLPKDICNSGFGYAECQWLGVQHDPVFISKEEFYSTTKSKGNEWIDLNWIFIECPSIAEMLDFMPKSFVYEHNFFKRAYELEVRWNNYASKYMVEYYCFVNRECLVNYTNILPNALAEMILWLHDNKYLTFSTHD